MWHKFSDFQNLAFQIFRHLFRRCKHRSKQAITLGKQRILGHAASRAAFCSMEVNHQPACAKIVQKHPATLQSMPKLCSVAGGRQNLRRMSASAACHHQTFKFPHASAKHYTQPLFAQIIDGSHKAQLHNRTCGT